MPRQTLFGDGLHHALEDDTTFLRNVLPLKIELKLDWIWQRGLSAQRSGIDRAITVFDHVPLWTVVKTD